MCVLCVCVEPHSMFEMYNSNIFKKTGGGERMEIEAAGKWERMLLASVRTTRWPCVWGGEILAYRTRQGSNIVHTYTIYVPRSVQKPTMVVDGVV